MKICLTRKQINDVLYAIGNWTTDSQILRENFQDRGKSLLRAEATLNAAIAEQEREMNKQSNIDLDDGDPGVARSEENFGPVPG